MKELNWILKEDEDLENNERVNLCEEVFEQKIL